MCVCASGWLGVGVQVPHCICLEGVRTAGRSHFSPTIRVLRIELRLLALGRSTFSHGGIIFPTPFQKCVMCLHVHVCMYVHQWNTEDNPRCHP